MLKKIITCCAISLLVGILTACDRNNPSQTPMSSDNVTTAPRTTGTANQVNTPSEATGANYTTSNSNKYDTNAEDTSKDNRSSNRVDQGVPNNR